MPSRLRTPRPPSLPSAIAVCGRDDAVHRRAEQRQLEQVRPELPADVDVLRVARPAARDDRDVVEAVSLPRFLAAADLYVHRDPPRCKKPRRRVSPGPEKPSVASPLNWQSIVSASPDVGQCATGSSSTTSTPPVRRLASRGSNRPAPTSSVEAAPAATAARSASSIGLPACRAARKPGQQHVTGPDRGERLDARRDAAEPLHLALLVEEREAARLLGDQDVARAELGDRVERRRRSPAPRGTPGRRGSRPRAGSARRGTARRPSRAEAARLRSRGPSATPAPVQVADRLRVEVVRRRRAEASPRRRPSAAPFAR